MPMLQEYQDHCQKDLLPVYPSLSTYAWGTASGTCSPAWMWLKQNSTKSLGHCCHLGLPFVVIFRRVSSMTTALKPETNLEASLTLRGTPSRWLIRQSWLFPGCPCSVWGVLDSVLLRSLSMVIQEFWQALAYRTSSDTLLTQCAHASWVG